MEHKSNTVAERFPKEIEAIFSQSYAEQRSRAVKRGMEQMVARGYMPTRPPLGYSKTKTPGLFAPNEDGMWLKNVMAAYAKDRIDTPGAIRLVTYFLKRKYNKQPTKKQVRDVFINPYYTGYIFWNGVLYEGRHTALISLEQHWLIHHKLNHCDLPEKSEGN